MLARLILSLCGGSDELADVSCSDEDRRNKNRKEWKEILVLDPGFRNKKRSAAPSIPVRPIWASDERSDGWPWWLFEGKKMALRGPLF
jgi:hypothetical protein